MITIRKFGGLRGSISAGSPYTLAPTSTVGFTLPSVAGPRHASMTPQAFATPSLIATEAEYNMPPVTQPQIMAEVRNATSRQPYGSGSPAGATEGSPGGEDTQTAFFILNAEAAPVQTEFQHFVDDPTEGGRYPGRVTSMSPEVAPQGSFAKTWGPPLAAVAVIGAAVWILRR